MKYFNTAMLWLLAGGLILAGLTTVFTGFYMGLTFMMAGALCHPSAREKISGYIERPYTSKHNALVVVALLLTALVLGSNNQDREA